mgnify:CR=1 FL=1
MPSNRNILRQDWQIRYAEIMDRERTQSNFTLRAGMLELSTFFLAFSVSAPYALIQKLRGKPWDYLLYDTRGAFPQFFPVYTSLLSQEFWRGVVFFALGVLGILLCFIDKIEWQSLLVQIGRAHV